MFELPVQLILTMFFVLLLIANGYLQLRILKRKKSQMVMGNHSLADAFDLVDIRNKALQCRV